jgi:S-methylmethionine-dependent homocysteine/selenocysteine methylase
VHELLIYDERSRVMMAELYGSYIEIARGADVPILIGAPTWRANRGRISASGVTEDVNGDGVRFLKDIRHLWGSWAGNIFIGGLIGCKNDCYKPAEGLSREEAEEFHAWQIDRLVEAGVDLLMAVTLPAVEEAAGIARALARTDIPFVVSFVIGRDGRVLDGSELERAFDEVEAACERAPLGFMINCAHPSFLGPREQPASVMDGLIGFQGNSSALDHAELDGAETLAVDDVSEWGGLMIELNRDYGVTILGGCCGTGRDHLEYIVGHIGTGRRGAHCSLHEDRSSRKK